MEHTITEDEAALYDRQIRLWGLEAQHRMRNASILIAGMRALSNEVCKNIILAGVGSITILEHESVTEEDLGAQFLLRHDDIGHNRGEAAAEKARHLNPRVKVIVDQEDISQKPDSFFTQFNVVCLTGCDPEQALAHGGHLPNASGQEDMDSLFKLRDERLKSAEVDSGFVDNQLLQTLAETASAEIAPVCAIVGGFLAQDILKTLSGKDAPLLNYFLYNGLEGTGLVHHVQKKSS
ncbi:SUMO-activating enzyme subunit 1 [Linnemannia zychae]|nr:SUMO-activating enzyme subunit 1 [Linnemannia zychae]